MASPTDTKKLRFAYADPPYIGCSHYYEHPESAKYDDPKSHIALMHQMQSDYDGWALSCHEPSLRHLTPEMPGGARVAAWVKPFAAYKANVRVAYAWEPVIWNRTAPRRPDDPVGRDFLSCPITLRRGFTGAKPEAFALWLTVLLGAQPYDTWDDLFIGSGAVSEALNKPRLL